MIKDKLLEAHKATPILDDAEVKAMTSFMASNNWASRLAKQLGWKPKTLHGEAGAVDINAIEPEIQKIREKIAEYDEDNVYNMDETGLFFKCLPNRSFVRANDAKTARGTKLMKAKDRITLYVTTNATGTDKVPLSMIGRAKNPRCFLNQRRRLNNYSQNKAWSDSKVFAMWWQHFLNHIRRRTQKKTLLILDNCGPH